MAATSEVHETKEKCCLIEASVVTGFEESARGEAREKFDCDVKAARGKISWSVPVENVNNVLKLGSIDNARVVALSIPHFKFTDQYDSLARLQQIVRDVDWETGLQVWRKVHDFPHPIASRPDVIPSLEDMIDVVIMQQKAPAEKGEKKNRKGGRGKKKENWRDKGKGNASRVVTEGKNKSDTTSNDKVPESREENTDAVILVKDILGDIVDASSRSDHQKVKNVSVADTGILEDEGQFSKTVIIKKADPLREEPKIEIKVLTSGLDENIFPTNVEEQEQRDLEPMDIDQSLLKDIDTSLGLGREESQPNQSIVNEDLRPSPSSLLEQDNSVSYKEKADHHSEVEHTSADANHKGGIRAFASSVIEKLSYSTDFSVASKTSEKGLCLTPPPSPMVKTGDCLKFSSSSLGESSEPSMERSGINVEVSPENVSEFGSSVDPVPSLLTAEPVKLEQKSTTCESHDLESSPSVTLASSISPLLKAEDTLCTETGNLCLNGSIICPPEEKKTTVSETDTSEAESSARKKERDPTKPTFRVTCNRVGTCHPFDSSSAAASFGSAIITYFGWSVDLKNFDIEVMLNIDNEDVTVGIALTRASLHNRNLVAFGPTTLRATICYNMLRLCRIKNGDFICDPMCGTSALPIESALNWTNCYHFGGDFHEKAMERSAKNISALQEKRISENKGNLKVDAVQWNINHFPLRDSCVDVFVSDLPFGHRLGSRSENRTLYPSLLSEMARTARPAARACLLTEDKNSIIRAVQATGRYWQRRLILNINIGGLAGFVFLLTRTTTSMPPTESPWRENQGRTTGDGDSRAQGEKLEDEESIVTTENQKKEVEIVEQNVGTPNEV